ncbi:MAG TPA: hypothetical protein VMU94_29290 [Streptosporangiaceae bacterium]|nr:hypothetical protein [Streptosporangiaceae bacterium]
MNVHIHPPPAARLPGKPPILLPAVRTPLFGYQGSFVATYPDAVTVPASVKPVIQTARA